MVTHMTRIMFNWRLWGAALLIAFAVVFAGGAGSGHGHAWAESDVNNGRGLVDFPINDCGKNYWLVINLPPDHQLCIRGGLSEEKADKMADERGIWDLPWDEGLRAFEEMLTEIAQGWGWH